MAIRRRVTAAETRDEIERVRALAELRREQEAADREADRARRAAAAEDRERRRGARRQRRAGRRARHAVVLRRVGGRVRLLAPLLIVNAAAVYGQIAYAHDAIAPPSWPQPARLALAVGWAVAVEAVALYVGWHAHDALLHKAYSAAARLRRASYLIAAVVGSLNYAHFAGPLLAPTAAAVAFGLLSLLSPWLWGLHTRRVQHVQLLREDLVDETGAEFDIARRRAFPIRSWAARRWSIDHNVRDPRAAWEGYNAERAARRAARQPTANRAAAAWRVLAGRAATAQVANPPPQPPHEPATAPPPNPPPHPPAELPPAAIKVAKARARRPAMTQAEAAAKTQVSMRTVQRYWADTAPATGRANGRAPQLGSVPS